MNDILVAHDHLATARELSALLARLGYSVAPIATSVEEAIASATAVRPRLAMVSTALDGVTGGIALAESIHSISNTPVILIADEARSASLRHIAASRWRFVMAPFVETEVREAIEYALFGAEREMGVEMEERFFAVSLDLLCRLGFHGQFERLNAAWEHTLGYTRAELMSQQFIEFVHPDDRDRTLAQNREVRHGGSARMFENRYRCKDGSYRWFLWNAAPDESGRRIYSIARDITDRKLAETEREQLVEQLQTALAEVRTLREILPMCSYCRKIRDDENFWQTVENYISYNTNSRFSHGICPDCYEREVTPQFGSTDA